MKKLLSKLILTFLSVSGLSSFNIKNVTAQNLILNGGFETAIVGLPTGTPLPPYPSLLDNWSAVNTDGEFMYDISLAHSGTGFMSMLQNPGGNPAASWLGAPFAGGGYDRAVQIVNVSPSTSYQLQFWLRSGAGLRYASYDEGTALVQVEEFSPLPATITSFTMYTPLTWTQASVTFVTGSACTSIAVLFSIYDPDASDVWIDEVDLHLSKPTSVNLSSPAETLSVFQNTSSDELNIVSVSSEELYVSLFDVTARIFLRKSFTGDCSIPLKDFPRGVYFYSIINKTGIIRSGRFIK